MQIAMIAAGFTPGEADELRRAMAAWKRKGNLEQYHSKIVDGMRERDYPPEFAEQIFEQIKGFGDYGFPESHAASFAHLVYASSWLKCHEPAIFLAALLNSQPMGFYPPSQLVQDAKRHGVQVRPIDVTQSNWEASLEALPDQPPPHGQPAVRLGLSLVRPAKQPHAASKPRARPAGSTTSIPSHAARNSNAAISRRSPPRTRLRRSPAIAAMRYGKRLRPPRTRPARDRADRRSGEARTRRAVGSRRHPRRLSHHRPHAEPPSRRAAAVRTARAAAVVRGRMHDRPDGRARACGPDRAADAGHRERRDVHDARGRNGLREPDRPGSRGSAAKPSIRGCLPRPAWQVASDVRHLVVQHFEDLTPLLGGLRTSSREFH